MTNPDDDLAEFLATPEPADPARFLAGMADCDRLVAETRRTVRAFGAMATMVSRGQAKELSMRQLRAMAERCFPSECDRHVFLNWYYERLGIWLSEPLPTEN